MISQQIKDKAENDYLILTDITCCMDMDNIREVFKDNIIRDEGEYIDMNYKSLCVTFTSDMSSCKEYGGRAVLSDIIEVYNDGGILEGIYNTHTGIWKEL